MICSRLNEVVTNNCDKNTHNVFILLKSCQPKTLQKELHRLKGLKFAVSTMPSAMRKSEQLLSCQQLAGLFVFLQFRYFEEQRCFKWKHQLQGPGFPLDIGCVFIWCAATDDRWKIKQMFGPLLTANVRRGKQSRDNSFVSLDFVKSNKCYARVLQMIIHGTEQESK